MLSSNEIGIIFRLLNYNKSTNAFTMHRINKNQISLLLFIRRVLKKNPNDPLYWKRVKKLLYVL